MESNLTRKSLNERKRGLLKTLFIMNLTVFMLIASVWQVAASTESQQMKVSGVVTSSEDGMPIPGVSVVEKGTTNGAVSDMDGKYVLTVQTGATLIFSFVGMETQEVAVVATVHNVALQPTDVGLNEVVVTALGISREKKSLGYAVTEVGGEDVNTVKETNVINSLAGRVAGVVITKSNSGPGGGSRVVIRGNNSITGNNQPLYVVDGVPVDNSGFGSSAGNDKGEYSKVDYGTGISDINPDDIESMSVLKGPNAAALYGSRASNGVIIITTKKGKSGKGLGVSYSLNYTMENPLLLPKMQNEYGQGSDGNTYTDLGDLRTRGGSWGAKMDGSQKLYWTGDTRAYSAQEDNIKNFFRTGSNTVHNIALEGGTDKSSLRFSYTNDKANSILPNSGLSRHNFNFRGYSQISEKLSVDAKVTYFTQDSKNRPSMGTEGLLAYLYPIPRNTDVADLEDFQNESDYSVRSYTNGAGNPYWIVNNDVNDDSRQRFTGFAKATYKFNENLSIFGRIGTDAVSQNIESITKVGHWYFPTGRFNYQNYKTSETNADFLLMFNKNLTSDINLSVNAGGNAMYSTYQSMSIFGEIHLILHFKRRKSIRCMVRHLFPTKECCISMLRHATTGHLLYLKTIGRIFTHR